jgi:acyl carrier protein
MTVTDIQATIRDYIAEMLGPATPAQLDLDTPLLEQDLLDSVGIYELVIYLEERYEIEVLDEEVVPENFGTILVLAKLVEAKR